MEDFSLENNDLNESALTVNDRLTSFVQELDVIFGSGEDKVLSDEQLGIADMEQLLYQRNVNKTEIIANARKEIVITEGSNYYEYEVDVRFIRGNLRDIVLLDVTIIKDSGSNYQRTYIYK